MKITRIEVKHYEMPLDPPFRAAWDPVVRTKFPAIIVFVHTDEGFTGVGSSDVMVGFSGQENLFIGQDPSDIERHWKVLDRIDFHYGRCWPLDLALWDLNGKATGQPVAKLLGSGKKRILAYASTGELVSPKERAERSIALKELGFKAMKIRFHHEDLCDDLKTVEKVVKEVGEDMKIMVDANQGWQMPWDLAPMWDLKTALAVALELEQLGVFWLEEPLPHHDWEGMARLREATSIRIAGGEMNRRWHEFREMINRGCLDIYQPDAALCGGITGLRRVAQWADAHGVMFSPHTWTNGLGMMGNLHLALAVSNCPFLEFPFDPPAWTPERRDFPIMSEDQMMIDHEGYLKLPEKPGLGFDLDEKTLARYEVESTHWGR